MRKYIGYFLLPFVIALYPILRLYRANLHEVSFDTLVSLIPQIVLAVAVTWVVLFMLWKDVKKTSTITTFGVLYFVLYGAFELVVNTLYYVFNFQYLRQNTEAMMYLIVYSILYILVAGFVYKNREEIRSILKSESLSRVTVCVFGIMSIYLVGVISYREVAIRVLDSTYNHLPLQENMDTTASETMDSEDTMDSEESAIRSKQYPDIYYFIPDRYARQDILLRDYGFDNRRFVNTLEDMGFSVAENSTSNYPKTYLSLSSSLNGQYLQDLLPQRFQSLQDQTVVYKAMRDSWFLRLVRQHGYDTYHLGSWWEETRVNKYADYNLNLYAPLDEFTTIFLQTSVYKPIEILARGTSVADAFFSQTFPQGYDNLMYQVNVLENIAQIDGPTFTFMHLLSIHEPYIFDEMCNPGRMQGSESEKYAVQLQCTNDILIDIFDTIIESSDDPVIIVMQSDEGPITHDTNENNWLDNSRENLQRHMSIFQAYYSDTDFELPEGSTPVNTFRTLANTEFGYSLEKLPDRNYVYTAQGKPLSFTDVTELVQSDGDAVE